MSLFNGPHFVQYFPCLSLNENQVCLLNNLILFVIIRTA